MMHQFSPEKNVNYARNGTGRDTYIGFSNGGFQKNIILDSGGYEVGSMSQLNYKKNTISLPQLKGAAKVVHYNQDGTGRDQYIIDNDGGLIGGSKFNGKKLNYLTSLRYYQKTDDNLRQNDFLRMSQRAIPQKAYIKLQQQSQTVKNLTSRLMVKQKLKTEADLDQIDSPFQKILRKYDK